MLLCEVLTSTDVTMKLKEHLKGPLQKEKKRNIYDNRNIFYPGTEIGSAVILFHIFMYLQKHG